MRRRLVLGGLAGLAGMAIGGPEAMAAVAPAGGVRPGRAGAKEGPVTHGAKAFEVDAADTYNIGRIAGTDSMNQTDSKWQVGGTDLGSIFEHKGRLVFLFGDTEAPAGTQDHRDNVLAWSVDDDPADGITFEGMITDNPGHAKELIDHSAVGAAVTVIPTNGIALGDRMVMHYMGVDQWGDPGH